VVSVNEREQTNVFWNRKDIEVLLERVENNGGHRRIEKEYSFGLLIF
jgi:hypothetical protein